MSYYYSIAQASACLGRDKSTVAQWVVEGRIKAEKEFYPNSDRYQYRIPTEEVHKKAKELMNEAKSKVTKEHHFKIPTRTE